MIKKLNIYEEFYPNILDVDLFISNDIDPTHIVAGVSTPTITIFRSTDIEHCVKFMEYTGNHFYFESSEKITCHPCYKTKCSTKMECKEDIKFKDIERY